MVVDTGKAFERGVPHLDGNASPCEEPISVFSWTVSGLVAACVALD